jgi:hypothetical protein
MPGNPSTALAPQRAGSFMPGNPSTALAPLCRGTRPPSGYPAGTPPAYSSPPTLTGSRFASTPETAKTGAASPHWLRNALAPLCRETLTYRSRLRRLRQSLPTLPSEPLSGNGNSKDCGKGYSARSRFASTPNAERKSLRAYKEGIAQGRAASPPHWLPNLHIMQHFSYVSPLLNKSL